MSQNPSAVDQHKNLVERETLLLASKARLAEQMEGVTAELVAVRNALNGVQLGAQIVAEQTAAAVAASEAEAASAPSEN